VASLVRANHSEHDTCRGWRRAKPCESAGINPHIDAGRRASLCASPGSPIPYSPGPAPQPLVFFLATRRFSLETALWAGALRPEEVGCILVVSRAMKTNSVRRGLEHADHLDVLRNRDSDVL
jgi:hypothetical protein